MFENFSSCYCVLLGIHIFPACISKHFTFILSPSALSSLSLTGTWSGDCQSRGIGSSESELDASECKFSEDSDPLVLESEIVSIGGTSGGRILLACRRSPTTRGRAQDCGLHHFGAQ